jgi:hypothetical protein
MTTRNDSIRRLTAALGAFAITALSACAPQGGSEGLSPSASSRQRVTIGEDESEDTESESVATIDIGEVTEGSVERTVADPGMLSGSEQIGGTFITPDASGIGITFGINPDLLRGRLRDIPKPKPEDFVQVRIPRGFLPPGCPASRTGLIVRMPFHDIERHINPGREQDIIVNVPDVRTGRADAQVYGIDRGTLDLTKNIRQVQVSATEVGFIGASRSVSGATPPSSTAVVLNASTGAQTARISRSVPIVGVARASGTQTSGSLASGSLVVATPNASAAGAPSTSTSSSGLNFQSVSSGSGATQTIQNTTIQSNTSLSGRLSTQISSFNSQLPLLQSTGTIR